MYKTKEKEGGEEKNLGRVRGSKWEKSDIGNVQISGKAKGEGRE